MVTADDEGRREERKTRRAGEAVLAVMQKNREKKKGTAGSWRGYR